MRSVFIACFVALAAAITPATADQTVGVFINEPDAFPGYTLFSQLQSGESYLIDNQGLVRNAWESDYPVGNSLYLRENGNLVRTGDPRNNVTFFAGGDAGIVEEYTWDGTLIWSFLYSNTEHRAHHDIELMPNGNILIVAWERRTAAEAIAAGRDPNSMQQNVLWPEHLVEVMPTGPDTGEIVWEWHAWDHLIQDFDATKENFGVVADHPELIDINYRLNDAADWMHVNAIDYNAELDQIIVNSPFFGEFWIIDHSTTTEEAAGHTGGNSGMGGDILYRWGNPRTYRAGDVDDQVFVNQHDANWIEPGLPGAGNIMVFNNQGGPVPGSSVVMEIVPPLEKDGSYTLVPGEAYGPEAPTYEYVGDPPTSFFSSFISGARRMPNGNTLICSGATGNIFEVTPADDMVWHYINPLTGSGPVPQCTIGLNNATFRAERYPLDFPGFDGNDLTPMGRLETYTCPADTNFDGIVDPADLAAVLDQWGACTGPCFGDVNGDGVVGPADLAQLLDDWGACP